MLRGDINLAGRVFYRCKVACEKNPDLDPYKWIHAGLMGEDEYALKSCADEYDNPQAVRDWIHETFNRRTSTKELTTVGSILRGMK